MGFMDAYKQLEKLCGDVMNDDRRVSAYIEEMQRLNGSRFVTGWDEDLKQLKHCRWLRNQIAHDPDCTEENLCTPEDTQWVRAFYQRILNQTDPLAMYRKAQRPRVTAPRPKPQPKPQPKSQPNHQPTKKKRRGRKILWALILAALLGLIIWTIWGNTALELNTYTVQAEKLPESFNGFRIAQVADLHNAEFGEDNEKLLNMLRTAKPDLIAITGDLIDSYHTDISVALAFAEKAMQIAPCYYVPGNHEARIGAYTELKNGLIARGVAVLENTSAVIERSGEQILLCGVSDPSFQTDYLMGDAAAVMQTQLQSLKTAQESYVILLSHRPELMDVYAQSGAQLVLTGHAHGGQFRLPFVGGLVAPNQGLFPEYDGGMYQQDGTVMIVSRGIGNSIIPFRFNNRPEVVLIELTNKSPA